MNNLSILKYTLRVFKSIFIIPMMKLDPLGGWAGACTMEYK